MAPQTDMDAPRLAMRLSLWTSIVMLIAKCTAWYITGSSAIFSDAAESVIHLAGVGFAAFSLRVSTRPATSRYHYGFERISFFSAGFEGALIGAAALAIIVSAVYEWMHGLVLQSLGFGTILTLVAGLVNGALGLYLIRMGRKHHSLIVEANGKHVLTDCWTSLGVVVGLCLVLITGWKPFDPLCAIIVGLNILWSGAQLVRTSARGLMDYADPAIETRIRAAMTDMLSGQQIEFHNLRFRETGGKLLIEVHLLFPYTTPVGRAHSLATRVEEGLAAALQAPVEVTTHLESIEDHELRHKTTHTR